MSYFCFSFEELLALHHRIIYLKRLNAKLVKVGGSVNALKYKPLFNALINFTLFVAPFDSTQGADMWQVRLISTLSEVEGQAYLCKHLFLCTLDSTTKCKVLNN